MKISTKRNFCVYLLFAFLLSFFIALPVNATPNKDTPMAELKMKCDADDAEYCVALAHEYSRGSWLPKKPAKALQIFKAYCKQNNMKACRKVGISYFMGEGN